MSRDDFPGAIYMEPDDEVSYGIHGDDKETRQRQWQNGHHTTSAGKTVALEDMDVNHLKNTINKFRNGGYDVSRLEKELRKREKDNG